MVKDKLMNKKDSVKDLTDNNNKSRFIDQMIKSLNLHLHDKRCIFSSSTCYYIFSPKVFKTNSFICK